MERNPPFKEVQLWPSAPKILVSSRCFFLVYGCGKPQKVCGTGTNWAGWWSLWPPSGSDNGPEWERWRHYCSKDLPVHHLSSALLSLFQISQTHPVGTSGLVRANQSLSPVRQRVSQQTLLLGKGLKGSGQDQVLLRAQMVNRHTQTCIYTDIYVEASLSAEVKPSKTTGRAWWCLQAM